LRGAPARIEVTVPHGGRGPKTIRVYQSRILDEHDFTVIDGIRVTTVARTLLDLAGAVPPRELKRTLDRAERLELFDRRAIEDVLSRARGRRGAKALRHAIEAWRPRFTRQELEDRFFDLCEQAGFPLPLTNVSVAGCEVDAYWPQARLVVELAGQRVMRPTWNEVTKYKQRTIRRLRTLLVL
jgi:hypothetical protein